MLPLLTALKESISPIWASVAPQLERGRQWLTRPRDPIDWKAVRTRASSWLLPNSIASRALAVVILAVVLVGIIPWLWQSYSTRFPAIIPLGAGIGGAIVAWAALTQAATARRRHEAQTGADLQRRITENFTKAVEQLGSDKLEVRLGGIYSLERISKESPDDYWTVMESLTAFVRERSRRNEAERTSQDLEQRVLRRAYFLWLGAGRPDGRGEDFWAAAAKQEEFGDPPAADIAAVLTVFKRRSKQSREREIANDWYFDLRGAVLKQAILSNAHLEGVYLESAHLEGAYLESARLEEAHLSSAHLERAILRSAHLEGAYLESAHLEGANLSSAHLEGAILRSAHLEGARLGLARLEGADLSDAHLEGAILSGARLQRAHLAGANLEGAVLNGAHLEGAHLIDEPEDDAEDDDDISQDDAAPVAAATGLSKAQLLDAYGDAETKLPEGLARPAHWPSAAATEPPTPD